LNLLVIPKVFPRQSVIGGPILIHHRIKNLSKMGYRITILAPASSDEDYKDKSLDAYCEDIILIDSPKGRTSRQVKELEAELKRPPFFLSGDGGYNPQLDEGSGSVSARERISVNRRLISFLTTNSGCIDRSTRYFPLRVRTWRSLSVLHQTSREPQVLFTMV